MAKKSASSQNWLRRQRQDPFVKKAQKEGLRSRASYKLRDIQQHYRIVKKGACVIDLGAAPGSWSQEIVEWMGDNGKLIACDLLPMQGIAGVTFIQGDFTDPAIQKQIQEHLDGPLDVVVSDMAPNLSGIRCADQWASIGLNEAVLAFAHQHLKVGGDLVMKCFQGEGFEDLARILKKDFEKCVMKKPEASRKASNECFAVCLSFKGGD